MLCSNTSKMTRRRNSLDYHERDFPKDAGYHKQSASIPCKAERAVVNRQRANCNRNRARHLRRASQGYSWVDYRNRGCALKSVYSTEEDAIRAAICISRETKPLRVYHCEFCGKWHLSSTAAREEEGQAA